MLRRTELAWLLRVVVVSGAMLDVLVRCDMRGASLRMRIESSGKDSLARLA